MKTQANSTQKGVSNDRRVTECPAEPVRALPFCEIAMHYAPARTPETQNRPENFGGYLPPRERTVLRRSHPKLPQMMVKMFIH